MTKFPYPKQFQYTEDDCPGHDLTMKDIFAIMNDEWVKDHPPECVYCGSYIFPNVEYPDDDDD
jgi:hypothetical protein